jgi:hypothetical protein
MGSGEPAFNPMISSPNLNPSKTSSSGGLPNTIDPKRASELLRMGVVGDQKRPLDRLLDRLHAPGGDVWFQDALRIPTLRLGDDPEAALARGRLGVVGLDEAKERSKQAAFGSVDANERLAATGVYYLCIASAAVHHNRLITSLPREELANAFLDFGAALPEPWSSMLGRAALLLGAK